MSENCENCLSQFPESQGEIMKNTPNHKKIQFTFKSNKEKQQIVTFEMCVIIKYSVRYFSWLINQLLSL